MRDEPLSLDAARRIAVAAQGYATKRRRATLDDVARAIDRLSCVQLDSISTVDRSHRLALASRVGKHPAGATSELLARGRVMEYWAHEACLVPVADRPLFLRRMRSRQEHHWWGPVIQSDPALARRVLRDVRARGPLRAADFEGRSGGMWELKPAKRMLEALWTAGKLAVAGRTPAFERLYDLPERVLPPPPRALGARATLDGLLVRAVTARGILTARGARDHYRLEASPPEVRARLDALARRGDLRRVDLDGEPAYLAPDADTDPPETRGGVLLTPFDNLLWDRAFARRALGFHHVIEVYKPAPQRAYGYYVLPLLVDGRLVGRADVKADRAAGKLLVKKLHWEAPPTPAQRDGAAQAADRLAWLLGLDAAAQFKKGSEPWAPQTRE